ncbi:hypothetical protein Patl1_35898 [Pistacia atlantica]|nr:hypothetical protein Patl1_35898 [Pistacia atlantica]
MKTTHYGVSKCLHLLKVKSLQIFLQEKTHANCCTLALDGNNPTANLAYKHWKIADCLLRVWIIRTLVEEALNHVIGLDTSAQVWVALKEAYAQSSQERQFQLNQQLMYMKKTQELPLNEYIRKFKEDLVHTMNPSLHQCLNHQCHPIMRGFIPANQPNKNFSNGSSSNASPQENHRDITSQICGKKGHPAIRCWYRFNHSIQPDNLPQAFTALQLNFEEWTSDTGVLAHMTSNEGNLHNLRPYTGNDHVMLRNGEFLKGTHIGDALLGWIDKLTQHVLIWGLKRGNLYAIRAPPVALFSSRFWVALEDI